MPLAGGRSTRPRAASSSISRMTWRRPTSCWPRAGFESVEHVKRYTAMGFGTDQDKLGINGMAILAQALGKSIPRPAPPPPNYAGSFGAFAGLEFLDPVRKTCLHEWHAGRARWRGQLEAALVLPAEDLHAAVRRECLAVRNGVGILDASTLGRSISGTDAGLAELDVHQSLGQARDRQMPLRADADENGMVFDDGVTTGWASITS